MDAQPCTTNRHHGRCDAAPARDCPPRNASLRCETLVKCCVCGHFPTLWSRNGLAYWTFRCDHGFIILDGGEVRRRAEVE